MYCNAMNVMDEISSYIKMGVLEDDINVTMGFEDFIKFVIIISKVLRKF